MNKLVTLLIIFLSIQFVGAQGYIVNVNALGDAYDDYRCDVDGPQPSVDSVDIEIEFTEEGMLIITNQTIGSDTCFVFGDYNDNIVELGYVLTNDSFARIKSKREEGLNILLDGEFVTLKLRYSGYWKYELARMNGLVTHRSSAVVNILKSLYLQ